MIGIYYIGAALGALLRLVTHNGPMCKVVHFGVPSRQSDFVIQYTMHEQTRTCTRLACDSDFGVH